MSRHDAWRERLAALIRQRLPVTSVPSVPDIHLHLAGPRSGLGRLPAGRSGSGPPYWAHVWSGGLILARHLLDHPGVVSGRRVLDLGCGSGLVAIAAARAGAREVLAVDIDPSAIVATGLNAALNGVTLTAHEEDLLGGPAPDVDLILVGDLFYEEALADRVCGFLDRGLAFGCATLIGDPGRAALPFPRLAEVEAGTSPEFGTGRTVPGAVYQYKGA